MAQMEMGQAIALASLALALATVAMTARRDRAAERDPDDLHLRNAVISAGSLGGAIGID